MGGSQSSAVINSLSQQITNIAMSTVQTCEVMTDQSQNLTVTNTGWRLWGKYTLEQKSDISSQCFNDIQKQTDIQNKIINAIAQATTAENVAVLGVFGKSQSEAVANLTNIIQTNVTMSNIQKSYNAIKQTQTATFSNSGIIGFEQVHLTQGAAIFAAATLKEIDKSGVFNAIQVGVDQQSSASMSNPLDFIAHALGSVSNSIMMSIVFFLVIIAVLIFGGVMVIKMLSSGADTRPGEQSAAYTSVDT